MYCVIYCLSASWTLKDIDILSLFLMLISSYAKLPRRSLDNVVNQFVSFKYLLYHILMRKLLCFILCTLYLQINFFNLTFVKQFSYNYFSLWFSTISWLILWVLFPFWIKIVMIWIQNVFHLNIKYIPSWWHCLKMI